MSDEGLWLISKALDQLEDSLADTKKKEGDSSHASLSERQQISIKCELLKRGDLLNDKLSLCGFFGSFAKVIARPLQCTTQTEKDGEFISKKMEKPLPTKFIRMAAALVVHHR